MLLQKKRIKMQYKLLINAYDKNGYTYEYWLLENGNTKLDYRHRIKWLRKYGYIPKGYDIHHIDKDKKNNELGELFILYCKGYIIYKSGNLLCLPKYLHSQLFHNVNG